MRKVLKNNSKTKAYLDNLPRIYLVGCWDKYGVWEFPFTGKYEQNEYGISIPLIYDYDDHNGTCDNYYLRRLDHVTSGQIVSWTQSKSVANKISELYNKEMGVIMRLSAKGMVKLNEISTKYRFRNDFELEQDEVYDFCDAFLRCVDLGLNAEQEDVEFIETVRDVVWGVS